MELEGLDSRYTNQDSVRPYSVRCADHPCTCEWENRGKQAEAEVVPSSSSVEVRVGVGVGVEVGVEVEDFHGWVGGWVVGRLQSNA